VYALYNANSSRRKRENGKEINVKNEIEVERGT
jgi:hypothetical protein